MRKNTVSQIKLNQNLCVSWVATSWRAETEKNCSTWNINYSAKNAVFKYSACNVTVILKIKPYQIVALSIWIFYPISWIIHNRSAYNYHTKFGGGG